MNASGLSTCAFLSTSERANDFFDAFFTVKLAQESNNTEVLDLKGEGRYLYEFSEII